MQVESILFSAQDNRWNAFSGNDIYRKFALTVYRSTPLVPCQQTRFVIWAKLFTVSILRYLGHVASEVFMPLAPLNTAISGI